MTRSPQPLSVMLVAGEPSGDLLGAQLVRAMAREFSPATPRFFGAGGPHMAAAGVELHRDLTQHSVIGLFDVLRSYGRFRQWFDELVTLAAQRQPDVLIGVDYGGFNLRLARAVRARALRQRGPFHNWRPQFVQFVSPQVWASRPGRARWLEATHDLLLSILPFEPAWYARYAPGVNIEFVGHPLVDRHGGHRPASATQTSDIHDRPARVLLLPGSRPGELKRHLPAIASATVKMRAAMPVEFRLVLPDENLRALAAPMLAGAAPIDVRLGSLSESLTWADVAIASTGTVTLECCWFGVPTVGMYRTAWATYQVGRRIVTVPHLAMPNLLAGRAVMPEFVQDSATGEALAGAALELLGDPAKRAAMRAAFSDVCRQLGEPGAPERAARAIGRLVSSAS
jgi:lipid-A-disaccharide synthase